MKFPETSRQGDPSHARAIERLDAARSEERRLVATAQAAIGGAEEHEAAGRLRAATEEVAARKAWVGWVEHGV